MYGPEIMEKWTCKDNIKTDPAKWHLLVNEQVKLVSLGAGCFWGTEKYFAKDFSKANPGSILATSVGFMHSDPNVTECPSYEDVCEDQTGHIEVVHMLYDCTKTTHEEIFKHFFTFHDPTTLNRQVNDTGT